MRIAVWHNLPSGGGKRALYYHVKGLLERGHHVEVWCPSVADRGYLPLDRMVVEHILPYNWRSRRRRGLAFHALASHQDLISNLAAMEEHSKVCAQQIADGGFDIFLAHPCKLFRVTAIGRYIQIPKVVYVQEPFRPLYEAMPELPWLAWNARKEGQSRIRYVQGWVENLIHVQSLRIQAREEVLNAQAYDEILVNSMFSRESVLRAYGLDSKICYLGIDNEVYASSEATKDNIVIGVGAFVPEKNIEFVIKSLELVKQPRPTLVWVGNTTWPPVYREELIRFASSIGVEFIAYEMLTDRELAALLQRARMMVYAPRLEPFGFAPLEANASGIPVVAVAEGGVRETIVDGVNGLLVEHQVSAFAAAIQRLLNDSDYAQQLGKNGKKLVSEKWSLSKSTDHLEQRLAEALISPRV